MQASISKADTWIYLQNQATSRIISGWNRWFLAYPDRALEQVNIATAIAQESGLKVILASADSFATAPYDLRRELEPMRERAQAAFESGTVVGFMSGINLGWADAIAGSRRRH